MSELLQEFLLYLAGSKNYSLNTINAYASDIADFLRFLESQGLHLNEIELTTIKGYLAFLKERGYNPYSMARRLSSLKIFYIFSLRKAIFRLIFYLILRVQSFPRGFLRFSPWRRWKDSCRPRTFPPPWF